ncbi:MAG: 1-deoxy-D-xylulose-5-phosphate synthase [Clostridia bacterium]|nr:1-deoxy-D-xylulose-5-phosphate synthase [Clostridia bacterium]
MEYKILSSIKSPGEVKKLDENQLKELCSEIRNIIIETVSKNGGHLASNLGAVELTVALHRVFNSPEDALIFDVGHQCYTHKLLTGRFDEFSSLRTENGLSGFMRPKESEHDPFVTGHSSNSISAAYGIYKAKKLAGESGTAVAVIGDGALTGGMAYEAINNAASGRSNFMIVLNDNKMSISHNVGALARSLTRMRNKPKYHKLKADFSRILFLIPFIGEKLNNFIRSIKDKIKDIVYSRNMFSALGLNYLGPVDGHNIAAMEEIFKIAQTYTRPTLVHIVTTKGKGYEYAENSPKNYHGVSPFDIEKGAGEKSKITYSDIAGKTLCALASEDDKICAVTAAMTSGTGLEEFSKEYKQRFFDVGIAEQHAVTFSAGLAAGGMKPFFVVYSSFLQRGYDQIIHDSAIAGLPLKLLIDRAGIVGEDGESHQGIFDTAYLTQIPGMNVYSPCYYSELEAMIKDTAKTTELSAIRYPRGCEKANAEFKYSGEDFTVIKNGSKKAIVTFGRLFSNAIEATEGYKQADVIKLNKIYPLSRELTETLLCYDKIEFFEEGIKSGGIGEHIAALLSENDYKGKYRIHAVNAEFVPQSSISSALKRYGLDAQSMLEAIKED